jgi:hypothetical protein
MSPRLVTAVVLGLVVVVALGIWGLLAPRDSGHDGHPRPGQAVSFEGGSVVVDSVYDVDLSAPMAGPAMKMGPSSGVPEIPKGFRWVSVDLTLASTPAATYEVDPNRFVVPKGPDRYQPVSFDESGGTVVPPSSQVTRTFTYQVPEKSSELEFWAPGSDVPVMLTLGGAPAPHGH